MNSLKKNLMFQSITQIGSKGLMFLVYMLAARFLGPALFGAFDYTNSYIQIIGGIFFDLGLVLIIVREVSAGNNGVIGPALWLKTAGGFAGCAVLLIISGFAGLPFTLLIFLTIFTLSNSFINLFTAVFRAKNIMQGETAIVLFQRIILVVLLAAVFYNAREIEIGSKLSACGLAFCLSAVAGLIAGVILTRRYFPGFLKFSSYKNNSEQIIQLLKEALPLIGVSVFWLIYYKIDIVLLGLLSSKEQVGLYSAAYRIMEASFLIPMIITNTVYPLLAGSWVSDKTKFMIFFKRTGFTLLAAGLLAGLSLFIAGEKIIQLLLGSEFTPATGILNILIIALIVVFPGQLMAHTLVIIKRQVNYLWISIAAAAINITLNIFLIPLWGAKAAAFSTIITELTVGLAALFIIIKYYKKRNPE